MRIGIDYTAGFTQRAGIGRFVRGVVGALLRIDEENEYTILYLHGGRSNEGPVFGDYPNVQERSFPISDRTMSVIWYRMGLPLPIDLFTGAQDVFYFPNYSLPPQRRGKSILTVHDLSFLLVPECADAKLRAFLERVVPPSVAAADFITADSSSTREDLICLLDVSPDKVTVVHGGVEERFARVTDRVRLRLVRERYGLHFPFLLYVGAIEPRKNIARLLQAYSQLRSRDQHFPRLVLAGGLGWLYQEIFQEAQDLGLHNEVVFIGHVADDDLPALYSLAELFVFPSLYEGFGLPPLEAMACGLPVIASTSSSLPEVVGDAGLLVEPTDVDELADAIFRVLTDIGLRQDLSTRGVERARQFTWEKAARTMLEVYRAVGGKS